MVTATENNGAAVLETPRTTGRKRGSAGSAKAATAEPAASKREEISIPPLKTSIIKIHIRGITPLLICRFDEKVRKELEDKTEGKAKNKKPPKNPEAEWNAARHISEEGWDGVHAGALRGAIIDAARSAEGVTMTSLKQAIFVREDGYGVDGSPLVRIYGEPEKFSNMCRTTTGVAYPRHRPLFREWAATVTLEVNNHILSNDDAANLLSIAGFTCGIGEWRPTAPKSKTGNMGRFEITKELMKPKSRPKKKSAETEVEATSAA